MSTPAAKTNNSKTKVKKVTASKKLSLRLEPALYNVIVKQAALQNRTVSNYLINIVVDAIDTTEYLLASQKNSQILENRLIDINSDELSEVEIEEVRISQSQFKQGKFKKLVI